MLPRKRFCSDLCRFTSYVHVSKENGGCWPWQGFTDFNSYGRFSRYGLAHRFAYEFLVGPIPKGLEIDHLCRNKSCVNPDHLEAVTHRENIRRDYRARGYAM